ncbi:MAG: asparagine synthetase B family protein, partial [Candidatus Thorarchaeota archaeon]
GIVGRSGLRIIRWYDISQEVLKRKAEKEFRNRDTIGHVRTLRRLFFNAVNLRLRSDVRVGSCLSGGIDSSSVVSVATRLLPQETEDIFQTYSAVYGSWFNEDERKYIEMLSSKTRTNSNFVTPTLPNFKDQFSHFIYHQEEPVTSPSPYSQLCVMKLAHSDGTKVLLDGQGADEILAGYDYMLGYYLAELLQGKKLWRLIKEIFMAIRRRNSFAIKSFIYQFLPKAMQRRLAPKTHRFLAREFGERYTNRHLVENLLYLDRSLESASINHIRFKLQHLLRWEDKNAMAFSIETRVPFLDHNLVTYVISLSSELKIRGGYTKWILRRAVEDLLPRSIRLRTDKIGFAAPEHLWINQSTESFLQNLKTCEHPLLKKYVDINELRTFLENRRGSLEIDTCRILFRVMCLYQWLKVFFNGVTC